MTILFNVERLPHGSVRRTLRRVERLTVSIAPVGEIYCCTK